MKTIEFKAISNTAQNIYNHFEQMERLNKDVIWKLKSGSPQWMKDLCREAHGDMMPDDWRYEFIVEALGALSDHRNYDNARESIEPDVYTHDLRKWFASRLDRSSYVDQYREEFGGEGDTDAMIAGGQLVEKWEVFDAVFSAIEKLCEDEDEEEINEEYPDSEV